MFWRRGRCRWWLGPTGGQGLRLGIAFVPGARGYFHEAAAGEGGQPAGFVDGQQMGVFKQDFEVLRGVRFDPGWTVPDKGLAESDRFASGGGDAVESEFAIVQFLLPGLWG